MDRVRVELPDADGETLVGTVEATGSAARFFSGKPFRASYDESIEGVPASMLTIPVLAHVCPVAWAAGADVVVDTVDAQFLDGLRRVRSTMLDLYPEFMAGGSVYCSRPVERRDETGGDSGTGLLFTGGVDSTASYVRHRAESPTLITVRGWVVGENDPEAWQRTRQFVESFADQRDLETAFVESNMLSFLATPLLQAHFQRYLEGAWYSSVGHGLGLLGLCAPVAATEDLDTIHLAATHTSDWDRPWGSRPDIDDHVRWTGTTGSHDGYDLSRQDKLELIGDHVDETGESITLRTCTHDRVGNCSDCEKCFRTTLGLLLAGRDPSDFGYRYEAGSLDRIRHRFDQGDIYVSAQKAYHWEVLQETARSRTQDESFTASVAFGSVDQQEVEQCLDWLDRQQFTDYVASSQRSLRHRSLQRIARNTPTPVYSALYPVYRRVRETPH